MIPEARISTVTDFQNALSPWGYEYLLSVTGVSGPGSMIVVFAGPADFYTACLTHDYQVVWVMSCGGQEIDANTDEANALFALTRERHRITKEST